MAISVCVFDAYGTLFDVNAAARIAAAEPGAEDWAAHWPQIASLWRQKQLEYSWLRTTAGQHTDFWQVTQDALDYALEAVGVPDAPLRQRLLDLYFELEAYPEVPVVLNRLKAAGLRTGILSNGAPEMLTAAIRFARLRQRLDAVLSVEDVGVFKPARPVYDLVGERFGCVPGDVLFVSSNGWDAAAAAGYGFVTAWVNRMRTPRERLWAEPDYEMNDLSGIPSLAVR